MTERPRYHEREMRSIFDKVHEAAGSPADPNTGKDPVPIEYTMRRGVYEGRIGKAYVRFIKQPDGTARVRVDGRLPPEAERKLAEETGYRT